MKNKSRLSAKLGVIILILYIFGTLLVAVRYGVYYFVNNPNTSIKVSESDGECFSAGCSGQLCVDEAHKGGITTCEIRAVYACNKLTKCERQTDGKCGWTPTEEYLSCVEEKS